MVQVKTKNGWTLTSHRNECSDTWEFISCGENSLANEVAALVREQGKYCEVDFSSYGWYVRIKIETL